MAVFSVKHLPKVSSLIPGKLLTVGDLTREEAERKYPFKNVWLYNSLCKF